MSSGGLLPVYLGVLSDLLPMTVLRRNELPKRQERPRVCLLKYKQSGRSHSHSVRPPQIDSSMRIPCEGLEREDRSRRRLVRCISERGLGD
jgi:hypothetical protein